MDDFNTYDFKISDAVKYGDREAIFLNLLGKCLRQSIVRDECKWEGHHWFCFAREGLANLFPFWPSIEMTRVIRSLLKANVIKIDTTIDQNIWFTII